jgi:hypothetical protein
MTCPSTMTRDNAAELTAANDGNLFGHGSTLPRQRLEVGATLSKHAMPRTIHHIQHTKGATP